MLLNPRRVWANIKVNNAVIMAAGLSSRLAPLSLITPKPLLKIRGEILIERQITQLKDAGIPEIYIVTGYKAEKFEYLSEKFGARIILNPEYMIRNNHSSIWAARGVLKNSYVCSGDNYFNINPFQSVIEDDNAYYAAVYADGETSEWCLDEDANGFINKVTVGGRNAWYMLGHTFWNAAFSENFIKILEAEYDNDIADKLWEAVFAEHLDVLKMKIRKYPDNVIFEFDNFAELKAFDPDFKY